MASLKLTSYVPKAGVHRNQSEIFSPNKGLERPQTRMVTELPIGGIAYMGKDKYEVVEAERPANCSGCDLCLGGICQKMTSHPCSAYSRTDQTWVIFKKIEKPGSYRGRVYKKKGRPNREEE